MEVFSGQNHQLIVNITARSPKLLARGLPPGRSLFLRVYASNGKGRSRSVTFDAYTLRMADKHPGKIRVVHTQFSKTLTNSNVYIGFLQD